jgi:hypothetical protein
MTGKVKATVCAACKPPTETGVDKNTTVVSPRPADDHHRRTRCLNATAEPDDDQDHELDPLRPARTARITQPRRATGRTRRGPPLAPATPGR